MAEGDIYYAKQDHCYVLKFVGDIRYTQGNALEQFLKRLFRENDFDDMLIDLSETTSIDSTNLGLLAKIANYMRRHQHKRATLVSLNDDVNQTLEGVGFFQVFDIRGDAGCYPDAENNVPATQPSKAELTRTVLEAHQTLSNLNEKNRLAFKSVLDAFDQQPPED